MTLSRGTSDISYTNITSQVMNISLQLLGFFVQILNKGPRLADPSQHFVPHIFKLRVYLSVCWC